MKISLKELASTLAEKKGLTEKEAYSFVKSMFTVVRNGIDTEGKVKMNGLGTFKVIDVANRDSVDVNTGERVTINGHKKLNFTAEKALAELVNHKHAGKKVKMENAGGGWLGKLKKWF